MNLFETTPTTKRLWGVSVITKLRNYWDYLMVDQSKSSRIVAVISLFGWLGAAVNSAMNGEWVTVAWVLWAALFMFLSFVWRARFLWFASMMAKQGRIVLTDTINLQNVSASDLDAEIKRRWNKDGHL